MTESAGEAPPQSAPDNPINIKLVLLVLAAAAAAIIGYGVVTGSDPLDPSVTAPVVSGEELAEFGDPLADGAVGRLMPTAAGTDFAGRPVSIEPTGQPQIILFLAHWCPICREEVPALQSWLDGGNLPDGVEFRSIATAIDSGRDNYPPDAWLEREQWSPDVLADTTSDVARAYGLPGFPYWVFVDAEGRVVNRLVGSLPLEQLDVIVDVLHG